MCLTSSAFQSLTYFEWLLLLLYFINQFFCHAKKSLYACTHITFQNDRNPNNFSHSLFFSRLKILEIKSNGKMEIALLLLITAHISSLYEVLLLLMMILFFVVILRFICHRTTTSSMNAKSITKRWRERKNIEKWDEWKIDVKAFDDFLCREAICGTEKRLCLMKIPSKERTHIVHHCEIDYEYFLG